MDGGGLGALRTLANRGLHEGQQLLGGLLGRRRMCTEWSRGDGADVWGVRGVRGPRTSGGIACRFEAAPGHAPEGCGVVHNDDVMQMARDDSVLGMFLFPFCVSHQLQDEAFRGGGARRGIMSLVCSLSAAQVQG